MFKKIGLCLFTAILLAFSSPAYADKEFIQKVQAMIGKAQEKAKTAQEAIQSNLDQIKSLREQAENMKEMATEDIASFDKALDAAQNLNVEKLKELNKIAEGLDKIDPQDPEKATADLEKLYVPKQGEGNDSEAYKKAQEFMQDVLRKAATNLYATGFTTRTVMQKEKPRDVDMSSSDKIAREIGLKSGEIIERLATIYLLESQMQNYQYTQAMKVMTVDAAATATDAPKDEENKNE